MGCKYCNAKIDGDFCDDACKKKYDEYFEFENKTKYWMYLGAGIGLILAIVGMFVSFKLLTPIGILILGATVAAFPLVTNWDIDHLGVKKAMTMIRVIGIIVVIIAIVTGIIVLV